jgi:hypothetical protein
MSRLTVEAGQHGRRPDKVRGRYYFRHAPWQRRETELKGAGALRGAPAGQRVRSPAATARIIGVVSIVGAVIRRVTLIRVALIGVACGRGVTGVARG